MNINNSQFLSIEQLQNQYLKQQKVNSQSSTAQQGMSFGEILLIRRKVFGAESYTKISTNMPAL